MTEDALILLAEVAIGERFTVTLDLPGAEDLAGYRLELAYDRNTLKYVGTNLDATLKLDGNHICAVDQVSDQGLEICRAIARPPSGCFWHERPPRGVLLRGHA